MQAAWFLGNLAKSPVLSGAGDRAVAHFTLISNEYAGKDESGGRRERQVSVQFTAFRRAAEALTKNARKGDQLFVTYHLANNNYERNGEMTYGYDFIVDEWAFGAPGKEKRAELEQRNGD